MTFDDERFLKDHPYPEAAPGGGEGAKDGERRPVPSVDRRMFTGVLGDVVAVAEPTTEADPVGVYASLLTGVGVLVGPAPHVQVGNSRHPLLVWSLLFGRTGTGRKGEAWETAATVLHRADPDYTAVKVTGLSSGEGLIERVRDQEGPEDGGVADKRLLVVEEEFESVMARAGRQGSTLTHVLRQAWAGKPLDVLNRKALRASGSHIGVTGHVTPSEFRIKLVEADLSGGFYNRFMPLYVERSKRLPIPPGLDPEILLEVAEDLGGRIKAARDLGRLQLDQQATELWVEELYDEFTAADDEDQAWTEFARRAAPYALRVAGLLTVLEGRKLITLQSLAAAGHLVRYTVASARYVLDGAHRNPRLDRIRRKLDQTPEGLSRSEVSGLFSRHLPKEALEVLLEELLTDPAYERVEVATGGRPAERYRRVLSPSFAPATEETPS